MSKGRSYREQHPDIPSTAKTYATVVTHDYQSMIVMLKHRTTLPTYDGPEKKFRGWWSPNDPTWVYIEDRGWAEATMPPEGKRTRVPQSDVEWAR